MSRNPFRREYWRDDGVGSFCFGYFKGATAAFAIGLPLLALWYWVLRP